MQKAHVLIVVVCLALMTCLVHGAYFEYIATTVAGGNGEFIDPQKIARLSSGDLIVSDAKGHAIKKISNGIVTTIAGTGVGGFSGDDGVATTAQLNSPFGIAVLNDEIYFADRDNHRVRKISLNGNISTIAGSGTSGFAGDGDLAVNARLNKPMDVSFNAVGELFIVDMDNYRIRKILTNGTIVTVIGNGSSGHSGDGDLALNAALSQAYGVRVYSHGIYISDTHNYKIRKVSDGNISTIAGSGAAPFNGDNILANSANLNNPTDVGFLSTGEMLIADTDNYRIRMVLTNGTMITIAGNGTATFSESELASSSAFSTVTGILVVSDDEIYIADAGNARIRLLSTKQIKSYGISTIVGGNGEFIDPQKIARLSNGDLIVSDAKGHSIKKISKTKLSVTTIAGTGIGGFSGDDGVATTAQLDSPFGIAILNDEIYFADRDNHRVRKISLNGHISTIAGTGTPGYLGDNGLAVNARLNKPMDVSFNAVGELFIVDMDNYRIRKILTNGTIVTVIGNGSSGHSGDGNIALSAALSQAYGVRVYSHGIYISDTHNYKIRKVETNQIITTIAGSGAAPFNTDNVLATLANLNNPTDVGFLSTGEMLIADTDNYRIRMVLTNGTMITIAGNGIASFSDGKIATSKGLHQPTGILVVSDDEIYIADAGNAKIRLLSTKSITCNGTDFTDGSVCSGHGVCTAVNSCICKQGWKGQYCNIVDEVTCYGISANSSEVCSGHGLCIGLDTCSCKTGYDGSMCTNILQQCVNETLGIYSPCFGNGNCTSNGCTCYKGFYGKHCTIYFDIFAPPITHAMLGLEVASQLQVFLENIGSIEYLWSQTSGPTISNLESLVGRLNGPTFKIPSKLDKLSLNNGLVAGQTYGFSLSAKIITKTQVFTASSSVTVAVLQDPKITFLLQDALTDQNITSGTAGTTLFKVVITSNSNQYSDSVQEYGFGFSDGDSITILTSFTSKTVSTFKLPYVAGQNSVDLYVACFGSNTRSVQKLTTISLINPVSNLTPTQAVNTISNLINSNSSATDLLGAASLLNTISTGSNSDINAKTNIRSTIISSLSNIIATSELGPALKALSSVTSTSTEITESSANTAFTALLGATSNPSFSKNDLQSIINVASNIFLASTDSASSKFSNGIASTLSKSILTGELVSASSPNFEIAVAKALQAFTLGANSFKFSNSARRQGIVEVCPGIMYNGLCLTVIKVDVSRRRPKKQRSIDSDSYEVGSKIYSIKGILENGTTVDNGSIRGYLEITIPYTPSSDSVPVCGLLDLIGEIVLDSSIVTTVNSGSVSCKTKSTQGNVLLLKTTVITPKNSTQLNASESLNKFSTVCLALLMCFISFLL